MPCLPTEPTPDPREEEKNAPALQVLWGYVGVLGEFCERGGEVSGNIRCLHTDEIRPTLHSTPHNILSRHFLTDSAFGLVQEEAEPK